MAVRIGLVDHPHPHPHQHPQAVNPIELGTVALTEILRRFYADFPAHPEEKKYNYVVSSSMKPTQVLF